MKKQAVSKWLPVYSDSVMFNGNIITVGKDFSIAEALAIKDGKIVGAGSNADMKNLAGEKSELMDLKDATILLGINDAHIHLNGFGIQRPPMIVDLGCPLIKSISNIQDATEAKAVEIGCGKWISGWGWDRGFLKETETKHVTTL